MVPLDNNRAVAKISRDARMHSSPCLFQDPEVACVLSWVLLSPKASTYLKGLHQTASFSRCLIQQLTPEDPDECFVHAATPGHLPNLRPDGERLRICLQF